MKPGRRRPAARTVLVSVLVLLLTLGAWRTWHVARTGLDPVFAGSTEAGVEDVAVGSAAAAAAGVSSLLQRGLQRVDREAELLLAEMRRIAEEDLAIGDGWRLRLAEGSREGLYTRHIPVWREAYTADVTLDDACDWLATTHQRLGPRSEASGREPVPSGCSLFLHGYEGRYSIAITVRDHEAGSSLAPVPRVAATHRTLDVQLRADTTAGPTPFVLPATPLERAVSVVVGDARDPGRAGVACEEAWGVSC